MSVSSINENVRAIGEHVSELVSRRYHKSFFTLVYPDLDETSGSENLNRYFVLPSGYAIDIVAIEIHAYAGDGEVFTVSISNGTTGKSISKDVTGAGTTTHSAEYYNGTLHVDGGDEVTMSISTSESTWDIADGTHIIVHYRQDRFAGVTPSSFSPVELTSSTTVAGARAAVNTQVHTNADADLDASDAAVSQLYIYANHFTGATHYAYFPGTGLTMIHADFGGCLDSGALATVRLLDSASNTVATATLAGTSLSTKTVDQLNADATQQADDADDRADDWKWQSVAWSGTVESAFMFAFLKST